MEILKLYRIKDWIKNIGICLVALTLYASQFKLLYLLPLIEFSLAYAFVFSINDFFDYKSRGERDFVYNKVKEGWNQKLIFIFDLIPLFILLPLLFFGNLIYLSFVSLFIILFSLYSIPPIALKRNYFLSVPINAICIGTLTFLGSYFFLKSIISSTVITFSIVFTSLIACYEIIHQISHLEKDRKMKIKSLPIVFGIRNSVKIIFILQFLSIMIALFAMFIDFNSNFIFIVTIFFSTLRIFRIYKWDKDFGELRSKIFGIHEVLFYIFLILFIHNFIIL